MHLRTRIILLHIFSSLFLLLYALYAVTFTWKIFLKYSTFTQPAEIVKLSGLFLLSLALITSCILFYKKKPLGWYGLLLFFAYASLSGIIDLIKDISIFESTLSGILVFDVISTGIYVFTLVLLLDKGLYRFIKKQGPHAQHEVTL